MPKEIFESVQPKETRTKRALIGSSGSCPSGSCPRGSCPSGSCPSSSCPSGSCPSGSCPSGSWPSGSCPSSSCPSGSCPSGSCPSGSWPSGSCPSGSCPSGSCPSGSCPSRSCPSGSCPSRSCPSGSCPSGSCPSGSWPRCINIALLCFALLLWFLWTARPIKETDPLRWRSVMSYQVYLNSASSTDVYPETTNSSFRVQLPKQLDTKGYKCALGEICFVNDVLSVPDNNFITTTNVECHHHETSCGWTALRTKIWKNVYLRPSTGNYATAKTDTSPSSTSPP